MPIRGYQSPGQSKSSVIFVRVLLEARNILRMKRETPTMEKLVEFEKNADGLLIKLLKAGRKFMREQRSGTGWKLGTDAIFSELIEWQTCNGWEFIAPEEIAALTSSPILSDSAKRNDKGELTALEKVFWFPNYQVESEIEILLEKGFVLFAEGK